MCVLYTPGDLSIIHIIVFCISLSEVAQINLLVLQHLVENNL